MMEKYKSDAWYWKLSKHRNNKRANWHDYHAPCFYMITINRNDLLNLKFSSLKNIGADRVIIPQVELSECGKIILKELMNIEHQYPSVAVRRWVIMPDHIHIVIWIKQSIKIGLGGIIGFFKGNVTKRFFESYPDYKYDRISVFNPGFHDRILTRKGMLNNLFKYVEDNPRRALIRRSQKDFFNKCKVSIGGIIFSCYGNLGLMSDPWIMTVRWSSKYGDGEWDKIVYSGREIARCGGVIISPFIHPLEKDLMKELLVEGANVIKLIEYGIGERWHAKGADFALCSQGKLLLLGKEDIGIGPHLVSRSESLQLNAEARWIADSLKRGRFQIID
ncbi:MAG: transposase [Muribaculaceae bacterium]|nr:transposase [Muribaculaceae bacterium]